VTKPPTKTLTTTLYEGADGHDPQSRVPHRPKVRGFLKALSSQIDAEDVAQSKYRAEYCEQVKQLAAQGLSLRSFCATIGVTYRTVQHWINCVPEFYEAAKIAEMMRHEFYERTAISNLENREFNSGLFNKLTQAIVKWDDKVETHQHIHIEAQHKSPDQMTARERMDRIRELQESLRLSQAND
jgi:hypothetical protein